MSDRIETRLQVIISSEASSINLQRTVYFCLKSDLVEELKSRGFDFRDKRKRKHILMDEHLVTVDGKFGVFFELSCMQETKLPGASQPPLSRFPASHSQLRRTI